jgi:hypothetical protein
MKNTGSVSTIVSLAKKFFSQKPLSPIELGRFFELSQ